MVQSRVPSEPVYSPASSSFTDLPQRETQHPLPRVWGALRGDIAALPAGAPLTSALMPLLLFLHFFNLLVFEAFDLFACCCLGARTEVVAPMRPSLGWLGVDHHWAHSYRGCQGPNLQHRPSAEACDTPHLPPPQSRVFGEHFK